MIDTEYDFVAALKNVKNKKDKIRIQAIMLRTEGWECVAIADELGCHKDTVSRWWKRAQVLGIDNKAGTKRRGRQAIVSEALATTFKSLTYLTQSYASPYRGEKLRQTLGDKGISMSLATVYRTLHRLDFSYQTTRPFNPKREESAVKQWKEDFPSTFKEVKKKILRRS
jgi:transposase